MDRNNRSVGMNSQVRKTSGPIPSDALATQEVNAEIHFLLKKGPTRIRPNTSSDCRIIVRELTRCDRRATGGWYGPGEWNAGEDASVELGEQPEDLVVTQAGFEYRLEHEIRPKVIAIVPERTVKPTAVAELAEQEVIKRRIQIDGCGRRASGVGANGRRRSLRCRVAVHRQGWLSFFDRETKPNLVGMVIGKPGTELPSPAEADVVLRVNRHRQVLRAIIHAMSGFGNQAPLLAAGKRPATVKCGLGPKLALAHRVAVALVVVGCRSRGKEVHLVVAANLDTAQLALYEHADTRLAPAGLKLRNMSVGGTVKRCRVEGGVDVGSKALRAPHRFCREEAARSKGHALETQGCRFLRIRLLPLRFLCECRIARCNC